MKNNSVFLFCVFITFIGNAQSFIGSWETQHTTENGENLKSVVIFSDGYQVITTYNSNTGKFKSTSGGSWKLLGDTMTEKVEFDSKNPERVGTELRFKVFITDSIMGIVGRNQKFKRIDYGTPGKLQGVWLMSGRIKDDKTQERDTNKPRKTMKILSGTRFQWIAYNTETKQFMGTGGGTYTTANGIYTEKIKFFSRDDSRVGTELKFVFNLKENKWHHSGSSSKGKPIYEIWSKRK